MVTTDTAEHQVRRVIQPCGNREPDNIKRLAFDGSAYVPWFAAGQPWRRQPPLWPHPMQARALAGERCWLCGRPRSAKATFLLTVGGALHRAAHELPSHWACAQYAATVWWPRGRLGRFYAPKDDRLVWLAQADDDWRGREVEQIVCLWTTDDFAAGARGIEVGEPFKVRWFQAGYELASLDITAALPAADDLVARLRPWLP